MRDINLNSLPMRIEAWPPSTASLQILYDNRGWAIRCYDDKGAKITTLVPGKKCHDGSHQTLVPREQLNEL